MKLNKQLIIILILGSLLLSSIILALYLYLKNSNIEKINKELVTVYIAKKDIKPNKKIVEDDIKEAVIAKKYILTKPLLKKEIIGKYTKGNIYKNDMFREEKISNKIDKKLTDDKILPFIHNSYNIKFSLFSNPNYSLQRGDYINIISVYPNVKSDGQNNFIDPYKVQFVAKNIKVLGFLVNGKALGVSEIKKEITKVIKKKKIKETVDINAQELIIDIEDKLLIALKDDYNRGKQLWMVKTNPISNEKKEKKVVEDKIVEKVEKTNTVKVKRNYPYNLYKPTKGKEKTVSATITYTNEAETIPKKEIIPNKELNKCLGEKNYILGTSKNIYFREKPSVFSKARITKHKNTIIPYLSQTTSGNWYITCDNYYIKVSQVKKISYKEMLGKLEKKLPKKVKELEIEQKSVVKKESILNPKECNKEFELIVATDIAHIRRGATLEHKILSIISKGDRVSLKKSFNDSWFETCEGRYLHKFEVKKVKKVTK